MKQPYSVNDILRVTRRCPRTTNELIVRVTGSERGTDFHGRSGVWIYAVPAPESQGQFGHAHIFFPDEIGQFGVQCVELLRNDS